MTVYLWHRRQSWGVGGVATPRFWAGGRGGRRAGRRGGRERVSENTIAYFAQKVRLESVFLIRKREKLATNVGVKGENVNIFWEKRQFLSWWLKKSCENFCLGNRRFFQKIINFSRLESKISATGFTTPRLRNRLTPLTSEVDNPFGRRTVVYCF